MRQEWTAAARGRQNGSDFEQFSFCIHVNNTK